MTTSPSSAPSSHTPSFKTKAQAKMRTAHPIGAKLPNTGPAMMRTPLTASTLYNSGSSNTSMPHIQNRQFTPRKRSHYSSCAPPTPRSTPCPPRFNQSKYSSPFFPPFINIQSLESRRVHLLSELQRSDFETTETLRSIHHMQAQLDNPQPPPPHEVKGLRRNLKIQNGRLCRSEEKEQSILQQLGEIAFHTQQIVRWERVMWESGVARTTPSNVAWMLAPPSLNGQAYGTQTDNVYGVTSIPSALAPPAVGHEYASLNGVMSSSPPNMQYTGSPYVAPQTFGYQHTQCVASQGFDWPRTDTEDRNHPCSYDTTSHVTSAATTRRNTLNTMMLPPGVPHNSRHGSIAVQGQGISGSDLETRIEQLTKSKVEGYWKLELGNGRFRKSEPGLVGGHWDADGQERGYLGVSQQTGHDGFHHATAMNGVAHLEVSNFVG